MTTVTVTLPKKTKERLQRLALRYGLSLSKLSEQALEHLVSAVPEESFDEYRYLIRSNQKWYGLSDG